jgi:hypothetical protein
LLSLRDQSRAAPAVAFTTVPVSMRALSDASRTAAFAVSETLAGAFRKLRVAICAIACSLVMFIMPAKRSRESLRSQRKKAPESSEEELETLVAEALKSALS